MFECKPLNSIFSDGVHVPNRFNPASYTAQETLHLEDSDRLDYFKARLFRQKPVSRENIVLTGKSICDTASEAQGDRGTHRAAVVKLINRYFPNQPLTEEEIGQ